jgi:hypothetical protein
MGQLYLYHWESDVVRLTALAKTHPMYAYEVFKIMTLRTPLQTRASLDYFCTEARLGRHLMITLHL